MNRLKNAVGIPVREWADGPWSFALRKKGGEDVNESRIPARKIAFYYQIGSMLQLLLLAPDRWQVNWE